MRLARILYCFFIFFPAALFGQVAITGKVVNHAGGKPLASASVYLNNATIGNKTATDGTFILRNVKPGKYELLVSIIGFETYRQPLSIENSNLALPVISLKPKTILLNEVRINPVADPKRDKYYEVFKDEFLGSSWRADECKILNPELLDLDYNDTSKTLTASSVDALEVDNGALGYKIKYWLTGFVKDNQVENNEKIKYWGSALFEEMNGTASQEQRWQKQRLAAYNGSLMQFLRCALNNTFEQAGFRVYRVINKPNPKRPPDSLITAKIIFFRKLKTNKKHDRDSLNYWERKASLPSFFQTLEQKKLKQQDFIKLTDQKGLYALTGNGGSLLVVYDADHRSEGREYLDARYDTRKKLRTVINFSSGYSLFDKNGSFTDPNSFALVGAWGYNRVAELLPVDYDPFQYSSQDTERQSDDNLLAGGVLGESPDLKAALLSLTAKSDSAGVGRTPEKPYVQFDKPYYAVGDTIWFKSYLFNQFLMPSDKSAILNIDLANDSNKVIKRYRLPVQSGFAWGNISLDGKYFSPGVYTLRAYTNWMRNFGRDAYYYKTFTVSGPGDGQMLVKAAFGSSTANGVSSTEAKLRFSTMNELPLAAQPVILQVINGGKRLYAQKYVTGVDGALDVNFKLPQKQDHLTLIAENDRKQRLAVIPVPENRPQNTDVQFLPEGGRLVAGLPARIGVKAIGEDGRGLNVSGIITDHAQKQVAQFKTLNKGIGSLRIDIKAGETYTAQVTLPGGLVKLYPLPLVKSAGTVLSIENEMQSDSLEATVAASAEIAASGQKFFLVGRARGIVCYAAIVSFHKSNSVSKKIAKSLFPTGITHFTLLTVKDQPLNERLVFIDRHDGLKIKLTLDKPLYGKRDSAALKLRVTDRDGDPVSGDFSMAVTDDAQVRADTLSAVNIKTRMLLTADLKGYIEQPGYYLSVQTPEAWLALDNLLLTQGWVGYDWAQVFNPPAIVYEPEREFKITGHVANVFNKPIKDTHVLLFSKSPSILMDTATDANGKFVFDRLPKIDTPVFILKAVNKRGKSFNVNVTVDDLTPPAFIKPAAPSGMPWFVNIDSTLLAYTKNAPLVNQSMAFAPGSHILKEVKITAKKIINDSQNLNGTGNADFVMDEKDLEAAGKKTWLQLLQENVKGFREGQFINLPFSPNHSEKAKKDWLLYEYVTDFDTDPVSRQWYFIGERPIKLIIDGISVDQILEVSTFRDLHDYLTNTAEDIKGLEVMSSSKFASSYLIRYDPYDPSSGVPLTIEADRANLPIGPPDIAFVEITTRSGGGPDVGGIPGMYLYKPLPISWPKAFYKPKYSVKDPPNKRLDLRSTIDWEPNIVTDANGEARIWFYTADKPSTYTITVEGTDMNGHLGYKQGKITVGEGAQK
jgi:hypothetical protein